MNQLVIKFRQMPVAQILGFVKAQQAMLDTGKVPADKLERTQNIIAAGTQVMAEKNGSPVPIAPPVKEPKKKTAKKKVAKKNKSKSKPKAKKKKLVPQFEKDKYVEATKSSIKKAYGKFGQIKKVVPLKTVVAYEVEFANGTKRISETDLLKATKAEYEASLPKPKAAPKKKPVAKKVTAKKAPVKKAAAPKEKVVAKKAATPKPVAKKTTTPKKRASKKYTGTKLHWGKEVPSSMLAGAKEGKIGCDVRVITADKRTMVVVPEMAQPGDQILVLPSGHPLAVIKKGNLAQHQFVAKSSANKATPKAKPVANKKSAPAKATPKKKSSTKTSSCSTNDGKRVYGMPAPLMTWFMKEVEEYKAKDSTLKIQKIVWVKKTGQILAYFKETDRFKRFTGDIVVKAVCPASGQMSKPKFIPKSGNQMRNLLSTSQSAGYYNTKGRKAYQKCVKWIREAYNLSAADQPKSSVLFKKYGNTCGDLLAKERNFSFMKKVHEATKKARKASKTKESYQTTYSKKWKEMERKVVKR